MSNNKLILLNFCIVIYASTLFGCASSKYLDDGTIIHEQKLADKNYAPHQRTLNGATIGAGVGAGTGAFIGAVSGGAVGATMTIATLGIAAPMIPAFVVAGATSGAIIGGATGGGAGAGIGYASDVYKQGTGLYEFTIKPYHRADTITVSQYSDKPIPLKSRVQIILKDDRYYIIPAPAIRN